MHVNLSFKRIELMIIDFRYCGIEFLESYISLFADFKVEPLGAVDNGAVTTGEWYTITVDFIAKEHGRPANKV